MSWALRDYCFPDVFFCLLQVSSLLYCLKFNPVSLAPNPKELFVCLSNQWFQSKIFHLPRPFHLNKKKLQSLILVNKNQPKAESAYNYKNVVAYVKYTDVICLYQGTNIYEFLVEKLKPSSTFYQYKRCLFLSRRVFLKDSHKVWRSRWEECNKNTSVYLVCIHIPRPSKECQIVPEGC